MEGKWLFRLGVLWILMGVSITLIYVVVPANVTISWQTETEFETAGFNILRSDEIDGTYNKINQQLINSQGKPAEGGTYEFKDETVDEGTTYYYRLEEVELDNNTVTYEPLVYQANAGPLWQPALAIFSIVVGLGLVIAGFRARGRKI